jgi:hypothetical protein
MATNAVEEPPHFAFIIAIVVRFFIQIAGPFFSTTTMQGVGKAVQVRHYPVTVSAESRARTTKATGANASGRQPEYFVAARRSASQETGLAAHDPEGEICRPSPVPRGRAISSAC